MRVRPELVKLAGQHLASEQDHLLTTRHWTTTLRGSITTVPRLRTQETAHVAFPNGFAVRGLAVAPAVSPGVELAWKPVPPTLHCAGRHRLAPDPTRGLRALEVRGSRSRFVVPARSGPAGADRDSGTPGCVDPHP